MQTGRNVDSAPAHWACDTVRFLEKTMSFTVDQIWDHKTAQTSIWFTTVIQQRVFLVVSAYR